MRAVIVTLAASLAAAGSASALETGDTMKAWAAASDGARTELLGRMLGKRAGTAADILVRKCVDDASAISGHADLSIAEVVSACQSSKGGGQPV